MNHTDTIKSNIFAIRLPKGINVNGAKLIGIVTWSYIATGIFSFFVSRYISGPFFSAYYTNRFWALVVVLPATMLAFDYLFLFHGFSIPLLLVSFLAISAFYGLLLRNSPSYVLADFVLLFSPILFYLLSQKYLKKVNIESLIAWLFHLNLGLGLLNMVGLPVDYDFVLLLVGLLLSFIFPNLSKYFFRKSLVKYILAITVLANYLFHPGSNKTRFLQVIAITLWFLSIRLYKKIINFKFIRNFAILTMIITFAMISGIFKQYRSYNLVKHFFGTISLESILANWNNPDNMFSILGQSTGHRIFELIKAKQSIQRNILTTLFGSGLGSSVDMSDSKDQSVLITYGENISNVRVFHLMPAYMLAKFGLTGIIIMLIGFGWLIKNLFWNLRYFDLTKLFAVSYLLVVTVGALFTFSIWIKNPLTGIMVWILLKRNKILFV